MTDERIFSAVVGLLRRAMTAAFCALDHAHLVVRVRPSDYEALRRYLESTEGFSLTEGNSEIRHILIMGVPIMPDPAAPEIFL